MGNFHYISEGANQRHGMTVFKTIVFDPATTLSNRILLRYALVNRIDIPVRTLANHILEYFFQLRESKLACAALFTSLRTNNVLGWNKTLKLYSG